ncbi:MAG TPA: LysM peptidoglycan-binding domain-containing protein, partial [Chthoniobacteraceae bacterium]|nr:LysM peptidoglycan-binding domain-containing protein [Chthoniobacteraceae bacterium]
EAAIDGTPATADVHYKLAQLYDEKLKNPLAAMHHYQRYLDLKPDGPHAKDAIADMKKDEREYASTLGSGAFMPQADAAKLENANIALQKQVNELRAAASRAPAQRDTGSQSSGSSHEDTVPAGGTTYMVMSGDTLASIARKFYKNSARWKDIEQANYSKLKGSAKLKPGMTLVIPK